MAIPWLIRQRIRINPNSIVNLSENDLTQEVIAFAFEQKRIDITRVFNMLGSNTSFIEKLIETPAFNNNAVYHKVFGNYIRYPSGLRERITSQIIDRNMYSGNIPTEIIAGDKRLFKHFARMDWDEISYRVGAIIDYSKFTREELVEFYDILRDKQIGIMDLPEQMLKNPLIVNLFLDGDFRGTVENMTNSWKLRHYSQEMSLGVKRYIIDHIDERIQDLSVLSSFGNGAISFNEREKALIINAARRGNFTFRGPKSPLNEFLYEDKDVVFNAIMNMEDIKMLEFVDLNFEFTPEEQERIAEKVVGLTQNTTIRDNIGSYRKLIEQQRSVVEQVLKKNIKVLDYFNQYNVFYYPPLSVPTLEDGQYAVNRNTPSELLYGNKPFFMEQLRKNFRNVISLSSLRTGRLPMDYDVDDLRAIYEIAKAHNYKITKESPPFLADNPFYIAEQVLRGERVIDSTYAVPYYEEVIKPLIYGTRDVQARKKNQSELIDILIDSNFLLGKQPYFYFPGFSGNVHSLSKTPEFALKSLRKNFLSVTNVGLYNEENCSVSDFTEEQLQEIASEYEKNRALYSPGVLRRINGSPYIYENPYIILNNYRRDGSVPQDTSIDLPDEFLKEIAEIYRQRNSGALMRSSLYIERANPYLALESIRRDPNSINYIGDREIFRKPEIKDEILRCIQDGTYVLGTETPRIVFRYSEVVDYVLDNERFEYLKYLSLSSSNLRTPEEKELLTRAKKLLFDGARKGLVVDGNIGLELSNEEVLELCRINPNYSKFLKIDRLVANEQFRQYLVRSIEDGTLIIDENIGEVFLNTRDLRDAIVKKPENLLYMEGYYGDNFEEIENLLISAVDKGTLVVGDNINFGLALYFNDAKKEKCINYVINKNPNCVYSVYKCLLKYRMLDKFPQVKEKFIEQIQNGTINVGDDFPERILNSSIDVMIECLRQNSSLKRKMARISINGLNEEQVVQLRGLLGDDFGRIVETEDTPSAERKNVELNPMRLLRAVREDPRRLYDIDPAASYLSLRNEVWDDIIKIALDNNYVLNANSPLVFRGNKQIILKSIKVDPSSIQFAFPQEYFRPDEERQILEALLGSDKKIVLNTRSIGFLKYNERYINYSLENASEQEIQQVIDAIEYGHFMGNKKALRERILPLIKEGKYNIASSDNFALVKFMSEDIETFTELLEADLSILKLKTIDPMLFTREEQERIYQVYLKHEGEYAEDEEMHNIMMENSYYLMNHLMKNPSMIEKTNLSRICLSDEFIAFFRNYYLGNNLPITESFPDFLRDDKEFVFQYLMRNNGNLNGLRLNDIEPLLDFSAIYEHPEYLQLERFYDIVDTPYNVYIEKWGKEKAFFFAQRIDGLVRYLDPDVDYDYENVKNDFTNLLLNRNNLTQNEIIEILRVIDIDLPESFFESKGYLKTSDELFLNILKNNPNRIRDYAGSSEEVFQMAIDSGLQLTEEILDVGSIRSSAVVFKKVLEENLGLFERYQGRDTALIKEALDRGFFDGRTSEDIFRIISANSFYAQDTEIFGHLVDQYGAAVAERYTGDDISIFEKIIQSGYFDDKSEEYVVDLLSRKQNFKDSDGVMSYLLDHYSPNIAMQYPGIDEAVFEKIINAGFFDGKTQEDVAKLLTEKGNFARNDRVLSYLLDNYPPDIVFLYGGTNFEIYQKAINKGLKIDLEFFEKRPDLVQNSLLLSEGIKNDKYCAGFKINELVRGGVKQGSPEWDQVLGIIKSVIGEDEYTKIVAGPQMEKEIINLCTISDNPQLGVKLLKCMDSELLKEMGLDEWKKVIKYAFNNPDINKLIEIVDSKQAKDFMELYKTLEGVIDDDLALGVNKFLKFANLYRENPELMKAVAMRIRAGQELAEDEQTDFYMIMYGKDENTRRKFKAEDLGHLTRIEKEKRLAKLGNVGRGEMMTDLATFLFNADQVEISSLLQHDIDSRTVMRIMKRAQKDGNRTLEQNCKYLYLLVDMLEHFNYTNATDAQLLDFAREIYSADEEKLKQIRKSFSNVQEVVRHFYEIEARAELTNIGELINNPDFVERDGDDLIVDLSKTRHTLYGHVLGTDLEAFFTTDRGKVTICVSPVSDKHEAYYYDGNLVLGFDTLPKGAFIGSATYNMGSNSSINYNDYSADRVRNLFAQTSIRDSYEGDSTVGHAETLLYRQNLVPSCIIMRGETPTEQEREARRRLEQIINGDLKPGDPNYRVIPLVRTQRARNRVFKYEKSVPREMIETETGSRQEERIDELRKKFASIIEFPVRETFIRNPSKGNTSEDYVIADDTVYVLKRNLTQREKGAIKAGARIQGLVHKDDKEAIIDVRDFQIDGTYGRPTTIMGVRDIDARSMWLYNRGNGRLSHRANQQFLREFLVDHLLCNYDSENSAFLMDTDETIYGIEKRGAGRAIDDFITPDGQVYTGMSYLYFDSNVGNNIYRKIFEGYINAPEGEEVLTDADLEDFVTTAEEIAQMDDKEYLDMYEDMFQGIEEEEEKERLKKVLLARKNNLGEDSRNFVDRLKKLREIEQEPEVIENPENIVLINDVHGNAEALRALLDECRKTGKKDIFILGDMIGFGPQSNECLDLLRESQGEFNIRCVLGNHELYSLMGNKSFSSSAGFRPEMTTQIRQTMSPENRRFIEGLPITRRAIIGGKKVTFTHFPIQEDYTEDSDMYIGHGGGASAFEHSESGREQDYVIYGHEHRTESTMGDEVGTVGTTEVANTTFVNLPSSGCVHGRKTSYVTLTIGDEGIQTQVHTVDYEREKLQEALLETDNPNAHFFGGIKESGDSDGER